MNTSNRSTNNEDTVVILSSSVSSLSTAATYHENKEEFQNSQREVRYDGREKRETPRPCYYLLRVLGIWQPTNSLYVTKIYTTFIWVLWASFIVVIFLQNYFYDGRIKFGRVLNNVGTVMDFCCPLVFLRYYFKYGNYEGIVNYVYYEISDENGRKRMNKIRYVYTALSMFMWVVMTVFFTFHWQPFWNQIWWHYAMYIFVLVYTMGWWSVWFSLYGFICHVHRHQVTMYKKKMVEALDTNRIRASSADSATEEIRCFEGEHIKIGRLLIQFNELHTTLYRTQCDFSKITSIAVAYHILDMFFFSLAYFRGDFDTGVYPIWNYIGTIFFDTISILIKLFPAALVCQSLHKTVTAAGDQCILLETADYNNNNIPYERFNFYQHLFYREQDMGFRILGVKITLRLTIGIVVTLGTAMVGFLRLVMS